MASLYTDGGSRSVPDSAPLTHNSPQTFFLDDGSHAVTAGGANNPPSIPLRRQNTAPEASDSSPLDSSNGNQLEPPRRRTDNAGNGTSQSRTASRSRKASGPKVCTKCGLVLQGQFVRALGELWHLNCFTCRDCGKVVASKFFPRDDEENPGKQYPLCETDYFGRLDLLCAKCGCALRGSYITAIDKKFHIHHFSCASCDLVFGETDSYYEHDRNVYCHYHYSTKFAAQCQGCQHAILKQFIELFKNGVNQHWHPECYMIHKFWNVRLWPQDSDPPQRSSIEGNVIKETRDQIWQEEDMIERKVHFIWVSLSLYEEKSASRISDMLLQVSNGTYSDSIRSARYFIAHCEVLFDGCAEVEALRSQVMPPIDFSYQREAKVLCKRLVQFFTVLSSLAKTGAAPGVSPELLSLVTSLAHYLKLLIRICLQGALRYEYATGSEDALKLLLAHVNGLDDKLQGCAETSQDEIDMLIRASSDRCRACGSPAEEETVASHTELAPFMVFHLPCLKCSLHNETITADEALWLRSSDSIICTQCARGNEAYKGAVPAFYQSTLLQHFSHLLKVAHARLLTQFRQLNITKHQGLLEDKPKGNPLPLSALGPNASTSQSSSMPMDILPNPRAPGDQASAFKDSLENISRMRSTRLDKRLSTAGTRVSTRESQVINSPLGYSAHPSAPSEQRWPDSERRMQIIDRHMASPPPSAAVDSTFIGNGPVLDDLSRLLAQEQAQHIRPNAARYAGTNLVSRDEKARLISGHSRSVSNPLSKAIPDPPKRFFSQQSHLEYFIIRHVAVSILSNMIPEFSQETLLMMVENRKTFWNRFYPFAKNDKPKENAVPGGGKGSKLKPIFGKDLTSLIQQDGAECTDVVGPGSLRVPAIIQDLVSGMRNMNMALEGVFRKNGNIRKQNELAARIDKEGSDSVDFTKETPIQTAALLKKFLRELPDPVLCSRFFKLWIRASQLPEPEQRRRAFHLTCCLLPKHHRDTMEVLFCFLNWVSSFHNVDEESGSKMDTHNLATVIAPNILFDRTNPKTDLDPGANFQAVEVVYTLMVYNEDLAEVPEEIQAIMADPNTFGNVSNDITTKEIFRRVAEYSAGKKAVITSISQDQINTRDHLSPREHINVRDHISPRDNGPGLSAQNYSSDNGPNWAVSSSVRPIGGQGGGMSIGMSTSHPSNGGGPRSPDMGP